MPKQTICRSNLLSERLALEMRQTCGALRHAAAAAAALHLSEQLLRLRVWLVAETDVDMHHTVLVTVANNVVALRANVVGGARLALANAGKVFVTIINSTTLCNS